MPRTLDETEMDTREEAAVPKVRRSVRRAVAVPIRVIGTGLEGCDFVEECVCLKVSQHGAQIRLKHPLVADDVIRIVNLWKNTEGTFRVVSRVRKLQGVPYADWGVEALDPAEVTWYR